MEIDEFVPGGLYKVKLSKNMYSQRYKKNTVFCGDICFLHTIFDMKDGGEVLVFIIKIQEFDDYQKNYHLLWGNKTIFSFLNEKTRNASDFLFLEENIVERII